MSAVIEARDITLTRELKMSPVELGWAASALIVAAETSEALGVTFHAHLTAEGMSATGTSTDRHRIHQVNLVLQEEARHVDVVIPRAALVWAKRNYRAFKPKKDAIIDPVAVVQITQLAMAGDDGKRAGWVSVILREWDDEEAPSARFDAPLIEDRFPPLDLIINDARRRGEGQPARLPLTHIADAITLHTPFSAVPLIEHTRGAKEGKAGPAILDFWEGATLRATALIQPLASDVAEGGE